MGTRKKKQKGHLMAAVMVFLAIMMILSTKVGQAWLDVLQRDNEAEMMFRARELVYGMVRFKQDQGRDITELRQLLEPGSRQQYFVRQLYKDLLVKNGKWGLLYSGPDGSILDPNSAVAGQPFKVGESGQLEPVGGLRSSIGQDPKELQNLPIIGVRTLCKERPFRVYKGLSDYSKWLFTIYDVIPQAKQRPGQQGQPGQAGKPRPPQGGQRRPGQQGTRR